MPGNWTNAELIAYVSPHLCLVENGSTIVAIGPYACYTPHFGLKNQQDTTRELQSLTSSVHYGQVSSESKIL